VALREKGITQEELDKAKTQYLKDFIFENETTDGTASSIGYNVTIGSLQDYLNHVSNVEKVTLDRVQAALDQYIDLNKATLVELVPSNSHIDTTEETQANLALLKASADQIAADAGTTTQPNEPKLTPAEQAQAQQPVKTILPNGITLLTKPLKDSATVAIKIFVKGGQGVESIPGTATLVSNVMMQGTTSRTAQQISRELESKGMGLSVSADDDYIEVTGTAIQEDLGELFAILKDVMNNPAFDNQEIAKKKEQMRQDIEASRDNPSSVAFENLSLALYPHHAYGDEGKRVEASLGQITRQDLLDYYNLYFQPQNMVVSVVGNVDPDTVRDYMTSLYPQCHNCQPANVAIPPVPALAKSETVTQERPQLSAVWLAQGWLVPPISDMKDYVALKVINSLIGTGMSSRLFVDLREKHGLAYVVGSLYPTREQQSRFVIYIGTDPVNTEKVQAGFTQEIKRLQTDLVPDAELSEAKSKLIGSYALAHDTNVNQAFYLGLFETLGTGYQFDTSYPTLINQVTPADIQRVAQSVFSKPSVVSLVKPAGKPSKNP
jgi:predicted Zn-dependent peptidase